MTGKENEKKYQDTNVSYGIFADKHPMAGNYEIE